jgi:hypothetical protein
LINETGNHNSRHVGDHGNREHCQNEYDAFPPHRSHDHDISKRQHGDRHENSQAGAGFGNQEFFFAHPNDVSFSQSWNSDITGLRKLTDLPKQARAYVDAIGELVGFPVQIVSVGPDREQTMFA